MSEETDPKRIGLTDPQGDRLFEAQWSSGLFKIKDLTSLEEVRVFVDEVTNSPWCIEKYGVFKVKIKPKLVNTEEIRNMMAIAIPYANILVFTEKGMRKISVLHELSHLFNVRSETFYRNMVIDGKERPKKKGGSTHGVNFARIFLSLVRQFMPAGAETLQAAYNKHGVRY